MMLSVIFLSHLVHICMEDLFQLTSRADACACLTTTNGQNLFGK
jgi:hypothetical protein